MKSCYRVEPSERENGLRHQRSVFLVGWLVHGWLSSKHSGLSGEKWPVAVQSTKEDVASMFVAMEGGELRILHKIPNGLLMIILV